MHWTWMPSPLNAAAYLFADLLTFEENSFSASFVKYNPITLESGGLLKRSTFEFTQATTGRVLGARPMGGRCRVVGADHASHNMYKLLYKYMIQYMH